MLADGSATVRSGNSFILATAVTNFAPLDPITDFIPLTVDFIEQASAGGFIPQTRTRRDMNNSEREILSARAIDRVLRVSFPRGFVQPTQVNTIVLSCDGKQDLVALAINAASASLVVGAVPFDNPVGAVRVARVKDKFIVNPTFEEMEESSIDLLYAGNKERALMVEVGADFVSEGLLHDALFFAKKQVKPLIQAQTKLLEKLQHNGGISKKDFTPVIVGKDIMDLALQTGYDRAVLMFRNGSLTKQSRALEETSILSDICAAVSAEFPDQNGLARLAGDRVLQKAVRDVVLKHSSRCDGRGFDDLRPLSCEVDVLPFVHGSAFFQRGETQTLCTVTLGPPDDALYETSERGVKKLQQFFLHYNFPPYSVNEIGRTGGLDRRMIGHGHLAQKALVPCLPCTGDFPYTIRVTSEVTMSNGSSSMASACGGSLALMDAGVPLSSPVAGVSVGLVTDVSPDGSILQHALLTDIVGLEDHHGDMDFKITGNATGISAVQLDLKLEGGIPLGILVEAIKKARTARLKILECMSKAINVSRPSLKPFAPKIEVVKFPPERKGDIIGPGGQTARELEETYECSLNFTDGIKGQDSSLAIFSPDSIKAKAAKHLIQELVADITVGETYDVVVREVKDFGLLVDVLRNKQGLIHISELMHKRIRNAQEYFKVGQRIEAKCIEYEKLRGIVRLSRKQLIDPKAKDEPQRVSSNECVVILPVPHPPGAPNSRPKRPRAQVSATTIQRSTITSNITQHEHPDKNDAAIDETGTLEQDSQTEPVVHVDSQLLEPPMKTNDKSSGSKKVHPTNRKNKKTLKGKKDATVVSNPVKLA